MPGTVSPEEEGEGGVVEPSRQGGYTQNLLLGSIAPVAFQIRGVLK